MATKKEKTFESLIPSRAETHQLQLFSSSVPQITHLRIKRFPHFAALHMKTHSQHFYLLTSCSLFKLPSDKYARVKRLIKEGNGGQTSDKLRITSEYSLMMQYTKDAHCNELLSIKSIYIQYGMRK